MTHRERFQAVMSYQPFDRVLRLLALAGGKRRGSAGTAKEWRIPSAFMN